MRTSPDFIFKLLLLSLEPYSATPPGVCESYETFPKGVWSCRGRTRAARQSLLQGTCGCHTAQQPTVLKHPLTLTGRVSAPWLERVGSQKDTLFLGVSTLTFFFLLGGVGVMGILTTKVLLSHKVTSASTRAVFSSCH